MTENLVDRMFLVVDWICTACVLDVIFVHILEKHFKHRKKLVLVNEN